MNYKEMYLQLFRSQTKAIQILQEAQKIAEERYMSGDEPILEILPPEDGDEKADSDCCT